MSARQAAKRTQPKVKIESNDASSSSSSAAPTPAPRKRKARPVAADGDGDGDATPAPVIVKRKKSAKVDKASVDNDDDDNDNDNDDGNDDDNDSASAPRRASVTKKPRKSGSGASAVPTPKVSAVAKEERDHKGLRHFSILVCEKLQLLKVSTYKEIADQLVIEASQQETSYVGYDEKNIRRRIYDALNVLMAMDIIAKDRKSIKWVGFDAAMGGGAAIAAEAEASHPALQPSKQHLALQQMQQSVKEVNERVKQKREELEATTLQYIGLKNLLTRNQSINENSASSSSSSSSDRMQWPFYVLSAPPGIPVECTTDATREMVILNFALPFSVHDHKDILQHAGLDFVTNAGPLDLLPTGASTSTPMSDVADATASTTATVATSGSETVGVALVPMTSTNSSTTILAPTALTGLVLPPVSISLPHLPSSSLASPATPVPSPPSSSSPFDTLVSAAAASPKLKPAVPSYPPLRSSDPSSSSSLPSVDPRLSIPMQLWSLLADDSVLKASAAKLIETTTNMTNKTAAAAAAVETTTEMKTEAIPMLPVMK